MNRKIQLNGLLNDDKFYKPRQLLIILSDQILNQKNPKCALLIEPSEGEHCKFSKQGRYYSSECNKLDETCQTETKKQPMKTVAVNKKL